MLFYFITGIKITKYHNKLLCIFWIFSSLIITNHYVSDIRAILIAEKEFRIESIQQIIVTDNTVIFVRDSHVHRVLNRVGIYDCI